VAFITSSFVHKTMCTCQVKLP